MLKSFHNLKGVYILPQVVQGIKAGEYRCPQEGDVSTLLATQFYIEEGAPLNPKVINYMSVTSTNGSALFQIFSK